MPLHFLASHSFSLFLCGRSPENKHTSKGIFHQNDHSLVEKPVENFLPASIIDPYQLVQNEWGEKKNLSYKYSAVSKESTAWFVLVGKADKAMHLWTHLEQLTTISCTSFFNSVIF